MGITPQWKHPFSKSDLTFDELLKAGLLAPPQPAPPQKAQKQGAKEQRKKRR